jgi:hypothetical protein
MRPLRVRATARLDSGPTTPITSTAYPRDATCSGRSSIALDVAELHAITMSFTPRSSRMSAICREKARSCGALRSP